MLKAAYSLFLEGNPSRFGFVAVVICFILQRHSILLTMRLLLTAFIAILSISVSAKTDYIALPDTGDTGFFGSAANRAKMVAAKHEFNIKNMRGALTIYRDILASEPKNASALYWTARCHYELKRYDLAKDYLERALAEDSAVQADINYFYGMIHHRLAELDEAIDRFDRFLSVNKGKRSFEVDEATRFISQCRYAKEMMSYPVSVTIENMGPAVNTRFDEYAPSVTADGQKLVFTSRRSDATGGEIDQGGDYKFYEDIYFTEWKSDKKQWSEAAGVEGDVNTPGYDAVLSIAPDGSSMFIYRNNLNSAGNIYMSKYNSFDNSWRTPDKLPKPINSSYFESSCSITADGKKLYFVSERPEGNGQGDIYVSEKQAGDRWSKPKNLGPIINTELDEKFVFIHPNGKTLYFASDGHQTLGSYDIFRSEYVNGQWSIPVNLGYPINTVNEESTFSLTGDNKTMFIAAEYADALGERDVYQIDVSNYELISASYERSNYATVILEVTEGDNRIRGAFVEILQDTGTDRVMFSEKSDKIGRVKVNLPEGDYLARVTSGRKAETLKFTIRLSESGETVVTHTVRLQ